MGSLGIGFQQIGFSPNSMVQKPIFFITIVTYISICHTVDDILTRFKGNKDINGEFVVFSGLINSSYGSDLLTSIQELESFKYSSTLKLYLKRPKENIMDTLPTMNPIMNIINPLMINTLVRAAPVTCGS